jgi:hypothetical protein
MKLAQAKPGKHRRSGMPEFQRKAARPQGRRVAGGISLEASRLWALALKIDASPAQPQLISAAAAATTARRRQGGEARI